MGLLQPGVFTTRGPTTRVLHPGFFITGGFYHQCFFRQGFFQPDVFQPGGLKTMRSYNQGYNQWFLQAGVLHTGVLATGCLTTRDFYMRGCYDQEFLLRGVFTTWGCYIEKFSFQGYNVQGSYMQGLLHPRVLHLVVVTSEVSTRRRTVRTPSLPFTSLRWPSSAFIRLHLPSLALIFLH